MSFNPKLQTAILLAVMNASTAVYDEHSPNVGINDELEVPFEVEVPSDEGMVLKTYTAKFTRPTNTETVNGNYSPVFMAVDTDVNDLRLVVCEGEAAIWSASFSAVQPLYNFILQNVNGIPNWLIVSQWFQERQVNVDAPPVYLAHLLANILIGIENVVSPLYPEIGQERFLKDLLGDEGESTSLAGLRSTPQAIQAYQEIFTDFNNHRSPEGQLKLSESSYLEAIWTSWVNRLKPHFPTLENLTASVEA